MARTIYIRCIYGIFGRGITKYTVMYGVYIRFWPTLHMWPFREHLATPECKSVCRTESCCCTFLTNRKFNLNIAGAQLHSGLLLLWWTRRVRLLWWTLRVRLLWWTRQVRLLWWMRRVRLLWWTRRVRLLWWTRRAEGGDSPGWRTASLRVATGLHQPSYMLCTFFACMTVGTHVRSNTGPWGCRYAVSTNIGHMRSSCICTRKASWGEQGTSSRKVHTILLREELPGSWYRHRGPCLGFQWRARKPLLIIELWLSRRGYSASLSMDCK